MHRQCLAQVFLDGFQAQFVSGWVTEAQDPFDGVDHKPAQLNGSGIVFSLQQAVHETNGRGEIVKEIADSKPGRLRRYISVCLGDGLDRPEVELVIDIEHYTVQGLQRIGDLNRLLGKLGFQQFKLLLQQVEILILTLVIGNW